MRRKISRKLLTPLFTLIFAFSRSMPLFSQEGTSKQGVKETTAQEKEKPGHEGGTPGARSRWEGIVTRSNKDKSTLTVRKRGSSVEMTVAYDSSTKFTSQEHGSKKVNDLDASQINDNDRVIVVGTLDKNGVLHATLISKRLSQ